MILFISHEKLTPLEQLLHAYEMVWKFEAAFSMASFKMQGLFVLVDKNWQLKSIKKK